MTNSGLREVYNAIATYYADDGEVEVYGIMNAIIRSMEAEEKIFVLTENKKYEGETYTVFVMLNDQEGHEVFPLFTDMSELLPIKQMIEGKSRVNVASMDLKYVLNFLVERDLCDGIVVNPAGQDFNMPLAFYEDVLKQELESHITLIQANITELYTDIIVSSTDEFLCGKTGVDAAIQKAGGAELRKEIQGQRLNVADVIGIESTGELHSKYVFFTRGPVYTETMSSQALYDCYYNSMNVAQQAECTSIAFPCIGAGENSVPIELVIDISTRAVTDWLEKHADFKIDVYFCCYEEGVRELYQKFFDGLVGEE